MRTSTLWVASIAFFSAPLLTIADAAPTPNQQRSLLRRYRIPVRRQNSGLIFINDSGLQPSSSSPAPEPSVSKQPESPASSIIPDPLLSISVPVIIPSASSVAPLPESSKAPDAVIDPILSSSVVIVPSQSASAAPKEEQPLASDSVVAPAPSSSQAPLASGTGNAPDVVFTPSSAFDPTTSTPPAVSTSSAQPPLLVGLDTVISNTPSPTAADPNGGNSLASDVPKADPSTSPKDENPLSILPSIIGGAIGTGATSATEAPLPSSIVLGNGGEGNAPASSSVVPPPVSIIPSDAPVASPTGAVPPASASTTTGADPQSSAPAGGIFPSGATGTDGTAAPPPQSTSDAAVPPSAAPTGTGTDTTTPTSMPTQGIFPPVSQQPVSPGVPGPSTTTGSGSTDTTTVPPGSGVPPTNTDSAVPTATGSGSAVPPVVIVPTAGSENGTSTTTGGANPLISQAQPPPTDKPDKPITQAVQSATGSDSATTVQGPTQIVVAPDGPKPTATPSALPKVIQPPGGKPNKDANAVLVQFGFLEPLNYQFVSSNEDAIQQLFQFVPLAVQYNLGNTDVRMQSIQPYDTLKTLKYVTTLTMLYVPGDMVSQLSIALHTPNSLLFNHPDPRVKTLMTFINPGIPLIAGQQMGEVAGAALPTQSSSAGTATGADPFSPDSQRSGPVNASSAVIAAPIAMAALAYGAAMIFVARRYSQRRRKHQRASSISGNPAWMAGSPHTGTGSRDSRGSGNTSGRSIRTQQISAPVMSANSLGWN